MYDDDYTPDETLTLWINDIDSRTGKTEVQFIDRGMGKVSLLMSPRVVCDIDFLISLLEKFKCGERDSTIKRDWRRGIVNDEDRY